MEKHPNISPVSPKLLRDQLVTVADLEEFKQDLLLSLLRVIRDNTAKPPKKWLKSREVKALLGISNGTLYSMRVGGTLPYTKIGNIIYYDQDDVNAVLTTNRSTIPFGGALPTRRAA